MKLIEKWKEKNREQEAKDVEYCKAHPKGWKLMIIGSILVFGAMSLIFVVYGAFPLAISMIVFEIWMLKQILNTYKKAFPKNVIS